jgi:hypothetical protein
MPEYKAFCGSFAGGLKYEKKNFILAYGSADDI